MGRPDNGPVTGESVGPLGAATVTNALLTRHVLDDEAGTYVGAVYDAKGALVPGSVRDVDRLDNWDVAVPATVARTPAVVGHYGQAGLETYVSSAVFAGHVFGGWGHLITESLATAWYADEAAAGTPVVFSPWGRVWQSYLRRAATVFDLAGWGKRPLVVSNGDLVSDELIVPDGLLHLDSVLYEKKSIHPRMNAVYERMVDATKSARDGAELVLLPRPSEHRRRQPEEGEVEASLVSAGFESCLGWELTVEEQIAQVASARVLVGYSGSNLHNSVFAPRGILCIEIEDERAIERRAEYGVMLQEALCDLRGQRFVRIPAFTGGAARPARDIIADVRRTMAEA